MVEVRRGEQEIDEVVKWAGEDKPRSDFPGLRYEYGVWVGISWVLGWIDGDPRNAGVEEEGEDNG